MVFSAVSMLPLLRLAVAKGAQSMARIGWVTAQQASSLTPYVEAFRSGLSDFGYEEGRNLILVLRYGDDHLDRVPDLAPVAYAFSGDPVSAGFADSLARPHANMTGITLMAPELTGKRLEILREINPALRRVSILFYPEHPGQDVERAYSQETAQRLGLAIDYFPTSNLTELSTALNKIAADPPQAISLFADGFALQNRDRIIAAATQLRLPVISGWPIFVESGAICSYGPNLRASYRRLAYYADRILKGTKPSDLPIEQPTKFELVINLKVANALGLTIPPSVLARADEVIE